MAAHVFYFHADRDARDDGWTEQSINWNDDPTALDLTLQQTKDGSIQFKVGAAIVQRAELDRIRRRESPHILDYERSEVAGNPYHGNLLLRTGTEKGTMKAIAGVLSFYARYVPNPNT